MNKPSKTNPALDRRAYSIQEACAQVGIGRTLLYSEMKEGRLRVSKIGRRTIIRAEDLGAWLRAAAKALT